MAKHSRTFTPSSSSSYGDGGFYFTQPVGAGGGYSDGGFYFTQPVGAGGGYAGANRTVRRRAGFVHPAYAGTHAYGAPLRGTALLGTALKPAVGAKATPTGKPTGGARGGNRTGTGIDSAPDTKLAAATASAATIKAFEDAASLLGEKQFWKDYWGKAKGAAGGNFSSASADQKKGSDDAYTSAERAAQTAYTNLIAGMPPFPVQETGAAKGSSTGDTFVALREYRDALIEKGLLKQAFRQTIGSRKASQPLIDAILRDVRDPLMKKVFKSTSSGTKVWELTSNAKIDPALVVMMAYIKNDPMTLWSAGSGNWDTKYWLYEYDKEKPGGVGGEPNEDEVDYEQSSDYAINIDRKFDDDFETNSERKKAVRSYTSWRLIKKFFTATNDTSIKSARTPWETRQAGNASRVTTSRTGWEAKRKTFVETARTAEQLTIDQQNNALTAKNKAPQAESAFDKARDFSAAALSARQGAEGAALVADVPSTRRYASAAVAAANGARTQSNEALRLAQEVQSLAARAGGLAANDKERADAASVAAERSAGEARESADAATAQIAVAESNLLVKQAEQEAQRASEERARQEIVLADAAAKAASAQALADAAKAAADRATAGATAGTVSAADAETARRNYEALQAAASGVAAAANAEQQKVDLAKAEADRIEGLAAAARDTRDEVTKDVFTPGEQEVTRLKEAVSRDMAPIAAEPSFFSKYKIPILATILVGVGGAALAWYRTRPQK